MLERVLMVACDERVELKIRKKLDAEGSLAMSVVGIQDVPAAVASFGPSLVIVDDKKLAPPQVAHLVNEGRAEAISIVGLSDKHNQYGSAIGIGIIDGFIDLAGEGCLYVLGCLGLILVSVGIGFLVRWLF